MHTHTDSAAEAKGLDVRAVDDDNCTSKYALNNDNRVKFNRRSKGSRCPQRPEGGKQVQVATQGTQKHPQS